MLLLSESAGFTLSLPGIAGLIVGVGITADSFIVYFERIRDEMRDGKSMRVAVESGWARARNTCLAADAVSLLAAVVLYIFATGVVKGFAFALGLSTLIDLAVFFWFTHPMVSWLARFDFFNRGHKLSGLDAETLGIDRLPDGGEGLMGKFSRLGNDLYSGKTSIDFVGRRWLWYAVSAVIVLVAVAGLVVKGLNCGIEFTGGAEYRVSLPADQVTQDTADELREAVAGTGIDNASSPVVTTSGNEAILVQTEPLTDDESAEVVEAILETTGAVRRRPVAVGDRRQLGPGGRRARPARPRRLPGAGRALHLGLLPPVEDVGRRDRGAGPRRRHHDRRLRPVRLRGHPGDRHRHPDDPRLLALRHGRRLRQGPREHHRPARAPGRRTPRPPTSRSTRPWCARSTPRSWR